MKKIEFKSKYSTGAYKLEFDSDSSEEEKEKISVKTKKSKGVSDPEEVKKYGFHGKKAGLIAF